MRKLNIHKRVSGTDKRQMRKFTSVESTISFNSLIHRDSQS
jgi:hypothetical protein